MNLLDGMKKNNTILNTKGSEYYATTYDSNLDVFSMLSRFNEEEVILQIFDKALEEDKDLALANLLYILDIRNGKGERRLFKIIYKELCMYHPEEALRILPFISELGRYDYVLVGLDTPIEKETIELIKNQLEIDEESDTPSLLAKWLPSHRSHGVNNILAKKLIKALNMKEKDYRRLLKSLRDKLNLVEKNLTTKEYKNIVFSEVPSKAMLKYRKAFQEKMTLRFEKYKKDVASNHEKIHTTGLFSYEIIKKIYMEKEKDTELYDLMWANQKDIFDGVHKNLLVVADTSGSMTSYGAIPYCTSVGLAIYIAERNQGYFKNHFITFSDEPTVQEIKGKTITEKVKNMREINVLNTDIDKVFDLILKTSLENKLSQEDLPETILIISDMEFDRGVHSRTGTNFQGWKKSFEEEGYKLPTIIFWNVAGNSRGVPVTKFDHDVAMASGFSTDILENLLNLEEYSPKDVMLEKLSIYLEMLGVHKDL